MIKTCDKCDRSWDEGKTSFHMCNPADVARKKERERWPQMSVEEKCEWLRRRIDEVDRNIPYNGPIG